VQEITRLQGIILHTANDTITGRLYRAMLELLLIEIGSFLPLHLQDFKIVGRLATDSLIKSTWEFLTDHNLQLITDLNVDLPRQDDCYLITNIIPLIEDSDHLTQINRCRLYLRVIFLSDVVDGSGKELLAAAWNGERILSPQRIGQWPNHVKPPPSAWTLWKYYLKKTFLGRGLRLKEPLGPW